MTMSELVKVTNNWRGARATCLLLALCMLMALPIGAVMAAENPDELIIYNGRKQKFVEPLLKKFAKEHKITIRLINHNATTLLNKMSLEDSHTEADLFISNDGGNLQRGSDFGLFEPLPKAVLTKVPANLRDANDKWVGLSLRTRVLVVNTESELGKNVKSISDLSDPRLKGRIGITTSLNESFIDGVTMYYQAMGRKDLESWLKGLKDNTEGKVYDKHSQIVAAVAEGKKDVGLVNHYYVLRHLKTHPNAPVRILFPDQDQSGIGAAWNLSGIAVSRYSTNKELAMKLVAFLLSDEGQKAFAEVNMEYPASKRVQAVKALPKVESLHLAKVAIHDMSRLRDKTLMRLDMMDMPQ